MAEQVDGSSARLVELADRTEVLQVQALCWCGRRATHNARTENGVMVTEGEVVVVGDGVRPSSTGRGYVLRRLIRRLLTTLRRDDPSRTLTDLPPELVDHALDHFRQTGTTGTVRELLLDEEQRFTKLLERGQRVLSRPEFEGPLSEEDYRYLHDTHGLPRDLVAGLLGR